MKPETTFRPQPAPEPLSALEARDDFVRRHIGPDAAETARMLETIGAASVEALMDETTPTAIRMKGALDLPPALGERDVLHDLREIAARNEVYTSMIGMGYHGTVTPSVIQRNVFENPGWYTAYTPYQAEISQGRLEALLNFQQMVMDFTGFDLANASLLDEATAAAEAMAMARRVAKSRAKAFFIDADTHPQTIAVLRTRAAPIGVEIIVGDPAALDPQAVFGALLSYPGSSGAIRDWATTCAKLRAAGAMSVIATDLLALALLTPPGEFGADIAVGSAQRFGVPMGYGGPHAAFFATHDTHKRAMPGRIIGVSTDSRGRPALRMALQTREQHIRRDKATSNICTSQALLAVMASMFAVYHGPDGVKRIARRVARMTAIAAEGLRRVGARLAHEAFFDTLTLETPGQARRIAARARAARINLRVVDADRIGVTLDETTRPDDLERLWRVLGGKAGEALRVEALDTEIMGRRPDALPDALRRTTPYLTHPVFAMHHGETEMMRYLRRLQAKDVALDRAMIPLGSCTMKLNAATEMIPLSWKRFAHVHPFAPLEQAQGYLQLFEELEAWLAEITGFAAVSLQPNAGSQGEYAGLLTIRRWHEARGEGGRDLCLIPSSAHGTNPASAIMAGMRVEVVKCDESGDIDLADLKAKIDAAPERLAALMVTYPSTHGVFEAGVVEACAMIHEAGGQVYLDGANLNALVGVARPGDFGADVCHMNLHKTFCIPHGGGGPGVGPIGVAAHLAPHLPDHPVVGGVNPASGAAHGDGTVAAAPWGSSLILPISWAYIAMMGPEGLRRASETAILSANYVATRLRPHFPVVYTGANGRVAHECIIDMRAIKAETGIGVEDVAKRLIDYGFHAPTMSWPVPETMMIEPTESESLRELDRFCDAMIAIRAEIAEVARGDADTTDNLLRNAPHTQDMLIGDWSRPYSRARAAFPAPGMAEDKYWPPVGRVDNVAGDRALICACPPMEAYAQAAE